MCVCLLPRRRHSYLGCSWTCRGWTSADYDTRKCSKSVLLTSRGGVPAVSSRAGSMLPLGQPRSGFRPSLRELWQVAHRCIYICSCLSTPLNPTGILLLHVAFGTGESLHMAPRAPRAACTGPRARSDLPTPSHFLLARCAPRSPARRQGRNLTSFYYQTRALSWNHFSCLFHSSRVQIARGEKYFPGHMTRIFKKV